MNSIQYDHDYALQFAGTLQSSCLVSRIHLHGIDPKKYFTLHSLAGKVLQQRYEPEIAENFKGSLMQKYVEEVLQSFFGRKPEKPEIQRYCNMIRAHKNGSTILNTIPYGLEILKRYQKELKDGYDWEDTFQSAAYCLKNKKVDSLYEFSFENIILVKQGWLLTNTNRNALDFFNTFCTWREENTSFNTFVVNDFGYIFKFKYGQFETYGHVLNLYHTGDVRFYCEENQKVRYALELQPSYDGCFY